MIYSHLVNIGSLGSYQGKLNKLLAANNLPTITIPDTPNSKEIINLQITPMANKPSQNNNEDSNTSAQPATSEHEESASDDISQTEESSASSEDENHSDSEQKEAIANLPSPQTHSPPQKSAIPKRSSERTEHGHGNNNVTMNTPNLTKRDTCSAVRVQPSPVSKHTLHNKDKTSNNSKPKSR